MLLFVYLKYRYTVLAFVHQRSLECMLAKHLITLSVGGKGSGEGEGGEKQTPCV